jgi:hypothetical protein
VENGHLEGELLATRARILEAGHAERWRIERDLHDRAQQRLVALRIHLSLAGERLDRSEERAMLERLGDEVDDAIDELRTVAHGIYPQILAQYGVGAALAAVARRSAMPTGIQDAGRGRHSQAVETSSGGCSARRGRPWRHSFTDRPRGRHGRDGVRSSAPRAATCWANWRSNSGQQTGSSDGGLRGRRRRRQPGPSPPGPASSPSAPPHLKTRQTISTTLNCHATIAASTAKTVIPPEERSASATM